MTNKDNQVTSISTQDLEKWVQFIMGGVVESKQDEAMLNRLRKRQVNVGDVTVLAQALTHNHEVYIQQLVEQNAVMQILLDKKLNITEDEVKEAKAEYDKQLETFYAQISAQEEEQEASFRAVSAEPYNVTSDGVEINEPTDVTIDLDGIHAKSSTTEEKATPANRKAEEGDACPL